MSTSKASPSRRKSFKTQLVFGYIFIGLTIVQGVLLIPLYLKYLDLRIYGLWLATGGVTLWLGMLDFGISSLIRQKVAAAYGKKNNQLAANLYFNGMLLQGYLTVLLIVVGTFISWYLPILLGALGDEIPILRISTFLSCIGMALTFLSYGQKNTADALQIPLVPIVSLILGSVITIILNIVFLTQNFGVISLPIGMLSGSIVSFVVTFIYVKNRVVSICGNYSYDRKLQIEFLKLSPSVFFGKSGGLIVNRIEPTIIALLLTPELAVAYSVTKQAADVVKMIADKVSGSVVAGFGHLFAEGNINKSQIVFEDVVWISRSVSFVCLNVFLLCNHSFILLWLKEDQFVGSAVTLALAFATFALVFSNLYSILLGAIGDIVVPSWFKGLESLFRLFMMIALVVNIGVLGLPLSVFIACGMYSIWGANRMSNIWLNLKGKFVTLENILLVAVSLLMGILSTQYILKTWGEFLLAVLISSTTMILILGAVDKKMRALFCRYIIK